MKAWVERKKLFIMVILKGGGEVYQVACAAFGRPPPQANEESPLTERDLGIPKGGISVYRSRVLRYTEGAYFGIPRWGTSVYRSGVLRYSEVGYFGIPKNGVVTGKRWGYGWSRGVWRGIALSAPRFAENGGVRHRFAPLFPLPFCLESVPTAKGQLRKSGLHPRFPHRSIIRQTPRSRPPHKVPRKRGSSRLAARCSLALVWRGQLRSP